MKHSIAAGLSITTIVAALALLVAVLVAFFTHLNIYGSVDQIPLDQMIVILALALGFLSSLAFMILFMILGSKKYPDPPRPLLLEEPEFRSDAPISLETRLKHELEFCMSHHTDISLLIGLLEEGQEELQEQLRQYFDASAFIYPFGEQRFGVILPFQDSKTAAREVSACFERFQSLLERNNMFCYGGMTSRDTRMVDIDTLIYEAEVSLERARHEKHSCVYCFHPDPEKYRRAVQSQ